MYALPSPFEAQTQEGDEDAEIFVCKFCGQASRIDPSDQEAPPDYCHPSDHGF